MYQVLQNSSTSSETGYPVQPCSGVSLLRAEPLTRSFSYSGRWQLEVCELSLTYACTLQQMFVITGSSKRFIIIVTEGAEARATTSLSLSPALSLTRAHTQTHTHSVNAIWHPINKWTSVLSTDWLLHSSLSYCTEPHSLWLGMPHGVLEYHQSQNLAIPRVG